MSTLITLVETLRKNIGDAERNENLSEQTQVHLATAIALNLPVPADTELTGTPYFNQHYLPTVRKLISEINELYLLDVGVVTNLVARNYAARFNFVHAPTYSIDVVSVVANHIYGKLTEGQPVVDLSVNELTRIGNGVKGFISEQFETTTE